MWKKCAWCGKPFYVKGGKDCHKKYCCAYCAQSGGIDRRFYQKAITDPEMALIYIKRLLRSITGCQCALWDALQMPRWDHLIVLCHIWSGTGGESGKAAKVVDKLLSMPAMQPLAEENPLWNEIELVTARKEYKPYKKRT